MGVLESIRYLILRETNVVISFIFIIFYNIPVRPFRHCVLSTGVEIYLILGLLLVLSLSSVTGTKYAAVVISRITVIYFLTLFIKWRIEHKR